MMVYSFLLTTLGFLVACSWGAADDIVRSDRIKVFLYAAPAFFQEVTIDAYKDSCTDLDNSLIDGQVQSILIGGRDVAEVMQRTDDWYCTFYKTYNCTGSGDEMLTFGAGVNNLLSSNWTEIHALRCSIENEWYTNSTYFGDS